MRRSLLVAVIGSGVLLSPLAAGSAGARTAESTATIKLGWNERALAAGRTVMTFNVKTLTVTKGGWTIAASFKNTSKSRLAIRKEFALLVSKKRAQIDGAPGEVVQAGAPGGACARPGVEWQALRWRWLDPPRCLHASALQLLSRTRDPGPDRVRLDHGSRRASLTP